MPTTKFEGISLTRDVKLSDGELLQHARGLSQKDGSIEEQLLHWDFGPIMEMRYQLEAVNYLFSDENVPFHWDGAFYREPRDLLFYCTATNGVGGDTLFLNTELLWDSLNEQEQAQCKQVSLKYTTEKKAHYGGEINVPLVQVHPRTGKTILRFAERVSSAKNPVQLEMSGVLDPDDFYRRMVEKMYRDEFIYRHTWREGDLLICDNFTYLHGRTKLDNNLSRAFKRIQIL